jgi:ABC-type glycerol-3-phosphate transport system permease component
VVRAAALRRRGRRCCCSSCAACCRRRTPRLSSAATCSTSASPDLLGNVRALFAEDGGIYLQWYANSVLYAVVGAALGALVSTAAGYAFDKYEFRGKRQAYALVLISVTIPGTVLALPMYLIASRLGLADTMWAVFVTVLFNPSRADVRHWLRAG